MFGIAKQKDTRMTSTQTAAVKPGAEPPREVPRSVQRLREIVGRLADPDLPDLDEDTDAALVLIRELNVQPPGDPSGVVPYGEIRDPRPVDPVEQREQTLDGLVKAFKEITASDALLAEWDITDFVSRRTEAERLVGEARIALATAEQRVWAINAEQRFQTEVSNNIQEQKGRFPILFATQFRASR